MDANLLVGWQVDFRFMKYLNNFIKFASASTLIIMEDINRLKIVLVEKKRTNKWLSEQLGVSPSTVSKWCTNSSQPDLGSLLRIADVLNVDIKELIVREYQATYRVLPD